MHFLFATLFIILFIQKGGLGLNSYFEKSKELSIFGSYDVVIIGGGCAGFTAAIAASRNGAAH